MTKLTSTRQKSVPIPSLFLWAVGQKAKLSNQIDDLDRVRHLFKKSLNVSRRADKRLVERVERIKSSIKENLSKGAIPFQRDDLDLNIAISLYALTSGFKVRSQDSYVESGFLRVRDKDIEYVDFSANMIRDDAKYPDLLDAPHKQIILDLLDELSKKEVAYQTTSRGNDILKICGSFESLGEITKSIRCEISLWKKTDGADLSGQVNYSSRKLGPAKLKLVSNQALVLSELSAQSQLELSAASMLHQWLLIESDSLKFFGELPDLTTDDNKKIVAVDPAPLFRKFLIGHIPISNIEKYYAVYF
jgi:hypothetical protein